MADNDYIINLVANIKDSLKSVENFSKSVDKEVSQVKKTFSAFTGFATGALAAIGVGFSLKKVIEEASAAEEAISSFNIILKQTKVFTEAGSSAFQDFAEALQRQTGIADEAILGLAGTLQRFGGLSQRDLANVTQATIDFAKFANIGFDEAGNAVAKALQGTEGALSKYGILVKDGKNETEQLANVMSALGIASGTAAAKTDNFSTQIKIITEEFSNLFENLGNAVIKNKDLADALLIVRGTLIEFTESVKKNDSTLASFVSGSVYFAIGAIQTFEHALRGIVNIARVVIIAVEGISKFILHIGLSLLKIVKPIADVLGVGGLLVKGIESVSKAVDFLEDDMLATGDAIYKSLGAPVFGESAFAAQDLGKEIEKIKQGLSTQKGDSFGLKGALKEAQKLREQMDVREQEERDKIVKQEIQRQTDVGKALIDAAKGFISAIQQGAAGVVPAIASIISGAFTLGTKGITKFAEDVFNSLPTLQLFVGKFSELIPVIGGVIAQAFQFLAQGPEAVRAQTQAFIDNIPVIIDNLVLGIPAFIDALAANSGKIASSLAAVMPVVASRLAIELIKQSPTIAKNFVQSMINEAGRLITAIADGVKDAISKVVGFGGGGGGVGGFIGGAIGGAKKVFGFSEGGIVPGGAPFSDRIPAMLTPGERVLTQAEREDIASLRAEVQRLSAANEKPIIHNVTLQMGLETFAKLQFQTSRGKFRTVAV